MKALVLLALAAFFLGTAEDCQGGGGDAVSRAIAPGYVEQFPQAICAGNTKYIEAHSYLTMVTYWNWWEKQTKNILACQSVSYRGIASQTETTTTYTYVAQFKNSFNDIEAHTWLITFTNKDMVIALQ